MPNKANKVRGQHRLPAAVMAQFSARKEQPLRQSVVAVRRRGGSARNTSAHGRNKENYVYDFTDQLVREAYGETLEERWCVYESNVAKVVESLRPADLVSEEVDATKDIIGTLLPYLAGVVVRGAEFDAALEPGKQYHQDNTNQVRVKAWQHAQAQLLNSRMTCLRPESGEFILNDLGYSYWEASRGKRNGKLLFPLASDLAILASRVDPPSYQIDSSGNFTFSIDQASISDTFSINRSLAAYAWKELYGSHDKLLNDIVFAEHRRKSLVLGRQFLGQNFDGILEVTAWQERVISLDLKGLILMPEIFTFIGGHPVIDDYFLSLSIPNQLLHQAEIARAIP